MIIKIFGGSGMIRTFDESVMSRWPYHLATDP